jgi:hypothetical protein
VGNPKTDLKGGYVGWKGESSFASLWFERWLVGACKCAYDLGGHFHFSIFKSSSFFSFISFDISTEQHFTKAFATYHIKTGGTAFPIALYCLFSETTSKLKDSGND